MSDPCSPVGSTILRSLKICFSPSKVILNSTVLTGLLWQFVLDLHRDFCSTLTCLLWLQGKRVILITLCTSAIHVFSRDFQCNFITIKLDNVFSTIMCFLLISSLIQLSVQLSTYVGMHWDAPALPLTFWPTKVQGPGFTAIPGPSPYLTSFHNTVLIAEHLPEN